MSMDPTAASVLEFWFGTTDIRAGIERRPEWFKTTPEFDAPLARDFSEVHERAARGELDSFREDPAECLALIVVLDQFSRNLHRGTPRAYACDEKALGLAALALRRGHDRGYGRFPRVFAYLPFEHSENPADQDRSVELFSALGDERSTESAVAHRDVIRRFGRFPHRNAVLGRANTPEEEKYLENPPRWGMTAAQAADLEARGAAA